MRTTSMRLVAAIVATSLGVAGIVPPALAQQPTLPSEQTPLEHSEQPMPPLEPPAVQAPPDSTMAQAQPPIVQPPAQPVPPAPPAPVTPPPPGPAPAVQPTQPDIFQETLKAQQRSVDRKQGLYAAGAVVTNIFLIPGRAITCALGAGVGVGVLALTFGTGYKAAASAFDEGCGGKWVVGPDDLKPDADRSFDWER